MSDESAPPPLPDPGATPDPPADDGPAFQSAAAPPPLPDPGVDDGPVFHSAAAPPPLPDPGRIADPDGNGGASANGDDDDESRALLHETELTRTYPCESCGGELHFDIDTQMLKCQHCGNTHELREDDGVVEEQDLRSALAKLRAGRGTQTYEGEKEVVCQNCGGHTTFNGSLTADKCPYCATPIQRDDVHTAPERLAVDGLLPFQVDDDEAEQLIDKWINSRWFAPNEFKKYNRTGAFTSVYMAYFTYDADTITSYRGQRGDNYTVTVGSGKNRRTETRTRWRPASGTVRNSFDDIPVFANVGFESDRIEKLEPWPTGNAKAYSPEYVAGHLCRTYDRDVEQCFDTAQAKIKPRIAATVRADIGGDRQIIDKMNIQWLKTTYKHVLLPIWLLTVIYEQKPFQVYINGVTGEVHGNRPYSKVKIFFAVLALTILVIAIVIAFQAASGDG